MSEHIRMMNDYIRRFKKKICILIKSLEFIALAGYIANFVEN